MKEEEEEFINNYEIHSQENLEFVVFSLLRPKKIQENIILFMKRHSIKPENICVIFYNYFGHFSRPILDEYLMVWSIETSLSILNLMVGLTIKAVSYTHLTLPTICSV